MMLLFNVGFVKVFNSFFNKIDNKNYYIYYKITIIFIYIDLLLKFKDM